MAEGVAVVITQGTFGSSAYMSEDKMRSGLGGNSLKIDAIPGWYGRSKNAWFWSELGIRVVSNTKSIAIMRSPHILPNRQLL